jgi:hypothetical protein
MRYERFTFRRLQIVNNGLNSFILSAPYGIVGKRKEKEKVGILAKEKAIINSFDGSFPARNRYDSKYFKYLGEAGETSGNIIDAFRTGDISRIENAIKALADSMKTHIFLIGMGCVIIDREALYADAGFHSYLDYAKHLEEDIKRFQNRDKKKGRRWPEKDAPISE